MVAARPEIALVQRSDERRIGSNRGGPLRARHTRTAGKVDAARDTADEDEDARADARGVAEAAIEPPMVMTARGISTASGTATATLRSRQ